MLTAPKRCYLAGYQPGQYEGEESVVNVSVTIDRLCRPIACMSAPKDHVLLISTRPSKVEDIASADRSSKQQVKESTNIPHHESS